MNPGPQPPPPEHESPSEGIDMLVTFFLLAGGAVFGRFYFHFALGARHDLALLAGMALLPGTLVITLGAWRVIIIPLLLARLGYEAIKRRSLDEGAAHAGAKLQNRLPGRSIFLLLPPLLGFTAGIVLGLLPAFPFVGTALSVGALGTAWGILLYILSSQGFLHFVVGEM